MKRAIILSCVIFLVTVCCPPVSAYDGSQILGQAESVMITVGNPNAKCAETPLGDLTADGCPLLKSVFATILLSSKQ